MTWASFCEIGLSRVLAVILSFCIFFRIGWSEYGASWDSKRGAGLEASIFVLKTCSVVRNLWIQDFVLHGDSEWMFADSDRRLDCIYFFVFWKANDLVFGALIGGQVDRILMLMRDYVQRFEAERLVDLLAFLKSRVTKSGDVQLQQTATALERSLKRYYIVYAMQNGRKDKVLEFFGKYGKSLLRSGDPDWNAWFGERHFLSQSKMVLGFGSNSEFWHIFNLLTQFCFIQEFRTWNIQAGIPISKCISQRSGWRLWNLHSANSCVRCSKELISFFGRSWLLDCLNLCMIAFSVFIFFLSVWRFVFYWTVNLSFFSEV